MLSGRLLAGRVHACGTRSGAETAKFGASAAQRRGAMTAGDADEIVRYLEQVCQMQHLSVSACCVAAHAGTACTCRQLADNLNEHVGSV